MKILSIILLATLGVTFLSACNSQKKDIVGEWKIQSIGENNSSKDIDIQSVTIMNILSAGSKLEFTKEGKYILGSDENKTTGKYKLSKESKTLEIEDSDSSYSYKIIYISDEKIELHSLSNQSVIYLIRD
jgi:heat shock protein HslJ